MPAQDLQTTEENTVYYNVMTYDGSYTIDIYQPGSHKWSIVEVWLRDCLLSCPNIFTQDIRNKC